MIVFDLRIKQTVPNYQIPLKMAQKFDFCLNLLS